MKQIIHDRQLTQSETLTGTTGFLALCGSSAASADSGHAPWSVAGTFRNFRVKLDAAPGTGRTTTFTLVINDVDTSVSVAIADPAVDGEDTSNSASISPGDRVRIRYTYAGAGTTNQTNVTHSLEFEGSTAGQSGYCRFMDAPASAWATNATWYAAPGFGEHGSTTTWVSSATAVDTYEALIAVPGTIARYDIVNFANNETGAPQAANAGGFGEVNTPRGWTFALIVNDVKQDGTGGTVDTQATLTDAATSTSWAGSLPIERGDRVRIEAAIIGYSASYTSQLGISVRVDPTTDGAFQLSLRETASINELLYPQFNVAGAVSGWTQTENTRLGLSSPTTFYVTRIVGLARDGGDNHRKVSMRVNEVTPEPNVSATVRRATLATETLVFSLACSTVSGTVAITDGDTWGLMLEEAPLCVCTPRTEYGGGFGYSSCCAPVVEGHNPYAADDEDWLAQCDGSGVVPSGLNATDSESWLE